VAWAPLLQDWVVAGGVVVVLDYHAGAGLTSRILSGAGLMAITNEGDATTETLTVAVASNPIVTGVSATYVGASGTVAFASTNATTIVRDTSGDAIVLHRVFQPDGGCYMLETVDDGVWPGVHGRPWVLTLGPTPVDATGSANTGPGVAHDGAGGMIGPSDWYYQVGPLTGSPGEKVSVWIRINEDEGEAHFGFSGNAAGARSLVLSVEDDEVRFEDNPGYAFTAMDAVPRTFRVGDWYRAEVEFGAAGAVTGRLFDPTGTALLNILPETYSAVRTGGVGLRSTGAHSFDTFEVCYP
jgi:hypothetical protein